jgi:hypothetical protein
MSYLVKMKLTTLFFILFGLPLMSISTFGFSFGGVYSDPNHPNCDRSIITTSNSEGEDFPTAYLYGTDAAGGKDCCCDGQTDKAWGPLTAIINGQNITVDFSAKGGPSNLTGHYNITENQIEWEDGNKWTKKTPIPQLSK